MVKGIWTKTVAGQPGLGWMETGKKSRSEKVEEYHDINTETQ